MNLSVSRRRNLFLLYGISFLQGMVFYAPVASLYRQHAGLSMFQITLIESISLILCLLLEFPFGILADRIGYRRTMIFSCGLYFLSKIVFWQAGSFSGFLSERILLAFAMAGLSGVDISLLYLCAPKGSLQKACGIYESLGTAGLLCSSAVFTLFLNNHYRTAALFTSVTYGAAFFLCCFLIRLPDDLPVSRPHSPHSGAESPGKILVGLFRNPRLIFFLFGIALLSETRQNITVFFNQLQYQRCGLPDSIIGILYLLTTIAGLSGCLSFTVTKRLGASVLSAAAFLLPAGFCLILALTRNPVLSAVCIIGIQFLVSLFRPLQTRFQNDAIQTTSRASALSLQSVFLECTGAMVSLVFGFLADCSLPLVFLAGTAACLAGYFLFLQWDTVRK